MDHALWMRRALEAAWEYQLLTFPNPAVGACVVSEHNALLGVGAHRRAGEAHAEVLALRDAYTVLSGDSAIATLYDAHQLHEYLLSHHQGCFGNCTIYVTLEPCAHIGRTPSCASLIAELGLSQVVIGMPDTHTLAHGGAKRLRDAGIQVVEGVEQEAASKLLLSFLSWQERPFVTFKWAQRLDGTMDGGIISSEASRRHVHAIRDTCDLLVIGGNTVRTDRPTLDARMVNGKAPDVLIYSRDKTFDHDIPLFHVPGRNVMISDSLDAISKYRNVLIEGGGGMFDATSERVDFYLAFISLQSGGGTMSLSNGIPAAFECLHVSRNHNDLTLWMQRR